MLMHNKTSHCITLPGGIYINNNGLYHIEVSHVKYVKHTPDNHITTMKRENHRTLRVKTESVRLAQVSNSSATARRLTPHNVLMSAGPIIVCVLPDPV